jgi:hypothetical protein
MADATAYAILWARERDVELRFERHLAALLVADADCGAADRSTGCPGPGWRCEACGDDHPANAVITVRTPVGVVCLTCCPTCADALRGGAPLPVTSGTLVRLVAQHLRHVGREQ